MLKVGQVKEIYEKKGAGRPIRGIAEDLGIARNTVWKYVDLPAPPINRTPRRTTRSVTQHHSRMIAKSGGLTAEVGDGLPWAEDAGLGSQGHGHPEGKPSFQVQGVQPGVDQGGVYLTQDWAAQAVDVLIPAVEGQGTGKPGGNHTQRNPKTVVKGYQVPEQCPHTEHGQYGGRDTGQDPRYPSPPGIQPVLPSPSSLLTGPPHVMPMGHTDRPTEGGIFIPNRARHQKGLRINTPMDVRDW